MTLQPFAKPSDLQVLVPGLTDAQAQLAVDLISGSIRHSLHWDVDKTTGLTYTYSVPRNRRNGIGIFYNRYQPGVTESVWNVVLPALHVTNVSSVVVDGTTQDPTNYDWDENGVVSLQYPASQKVTVTFDAGYDRAPEDKAPPVLRNVCLEYAAKLAGNPTGVRSYAIGQVREQFGEDAIPLADEDERLDSLRVGQL